MGNLRNEREKKLQRKLIPINILVCLVCIVATLSLFLMPVLEIDAGKAIRDDAVVEMVDGAIEKAFDKMTKNGDSDIDIQPVVKVIANNVLKNAEGKVSVSALSSFKVLVTRGDKSRKVLDELFFGSNALITNLIVSVVDGVVNVFSTAEGKALLEEAVTSALSKILVSNVEDEELAASVTQNAGELVGIFKELGDPAKVPDGKVDEVAGRLIDKVEEMLGAGQDISSDDRQQFIDAVQSMYDKTSEQLKEGETVSVESIICVAFSEAVDLSQINLVEMIKGMLPGNSGDDSQAAVHIKAVENENENEAGSEGEEGGSESKGPIVTGYDDLLLEVGLDDAAKAELKETLGTFLNDWVGDFLDEHGVSKYLKLYILVFVIMLLVMIPWMILFVFAFIHTFTPNKRFLTWYVLLVGWIPGAIWAVAKLMPLIIDKLLPAIPQLSAVNDFLNGEMGGVIQAAINGFGSFVWISGICYIVLVILAICSLPLKRKIKRERKYPEVVDAHDDYDENGDFGKFDEGNIDFGKFDEGNNKF